MIPTTIHNPESKSDWWMYQLFDETWNPMRSPPIFPIIPVKKYTIDDRKFTAYKPTNNLHPTTTQSKN